MTETSTGTSPGGGNGARQGRATLLVALSACGFASIPIFVILATRSGTPLEEVLIGRYVLATPLLAAIAWLTGTRRLQREGLRVLTIIGILQALIAYTSLLALRYISAGMLSFLFYTYPAWVAIIARVRHSEPLTRHRLTALALCLLGVAIMVGWPTGSLDPMGVALALGSALIYAAYVPLVGELSVGLSPPATAAYMAAGVSVIFVALKLLTAGPTFHVTPVAVRSMVGLAVVSTTLAFMLFLRGLRMLGPLRTAIVSTIEPFCTALLGASILGQPLTGVTLVGGVFIAGAVVMLQLPNTHRSGRHR
ncbi:MAG TPA: EamA family transporter [Gemmatimonadaceae bacterium]|nr:EamA family transporter [Gemmatimonadaceae bacterium]